MPTTPMRGQPTGRVPIHRCPGWLSASAAYRVMVITGFKAGRGSDSLSRGSLRSEL